ncbi:Pol polyprotein [Apostichopus japonicus]|uniref:Pol polyprotein n=1 Tax=Stichopus japonicus TaxID=307972 RepID=A0A2G8K287_STIJA|nr:Pol polyprotein [Apostichopus japonicus]
MFDFDVLYKPARLNQAADALSRRPRTTSSNPLITHSDFVSVAKLSILPTELQHTTVDCELNAITCETSECLTFSSYSKDQFREFQLKDPEFFSPRKFWNEGRKPVAGDDNLPNDPETKLLLREWDKLLEKEELLYRSCDGNDQLLLPKVLRSEVLSACHDDTGHQGHKRTIALVKTRCYWPKFAKDVTEYCDQCDRCTRAKIPPKIREPLRHMMASRPNELLAIDFTLIERDACGKENALIVV